MSMLAWLRGHPVAARGILLLAIGVPAGMLWTALDDLGRIPEVWRVPGPVVLVLGAMVVSRKLAVRLGVPRE